MLNVMTIFLFEKINSNTKGSKMKIKDEGLLKLLELKNKLVKLIKGE